MCVRERCPFARAGLDSVLMSGCPGYEQVVVEFDRLGVGGALTTGRSCVHLVVGPSRRGFRPICGLPGGPPILVATIALSASERVENPRLDPGVGAAVLAGSA